ncbi:MAG: Spy/CpxP family protein refolding chaperone [Plectolyngbya sp. WJT66-NPBG17]|jgi:Spy/CpxP family protein refolding chaperone|nr:Spy/CpxP family protein refolding chaperone [Plectolyngbya sp. WJT66-NPBG17]
MLRRVAIVVASTVMVLVGSAAVLRAVDFRQAQSNDAIAQAPDRPAPNRSGRGEMGLMRELNLSADQMTKIQQIRTRYRDELKSDRDAARQAQQELRTLMAGTATDNQIREKFRQVKDLRAKAADAQFNSMLEIRNVLSPEQRQKFADRMEKQRGGMRDRLPGRTPGI